MAARMAGDWIKMRAQLLQSPRLIAMSRALHAHRAFLDWLTPGGAGPMNGQLVSDDALRCVTSALLLRVWSAAREFGKFVGDDLHLEGVEVRDLDVIGGCAGIGESMLAVGWASFVDGVVVLPNFKQHNAPMTNAERQNEFRKRRSGKPEGELAPDGSALRSSNGEVTQAPLPDERRARGEREENIHSLKGDRIARGITGASDASNGKQAARHPSPRSPKDLHDEGTQEEPFDLSEVDWGRVTEWAERLGRKVPPRTPDDRRMWLRFAVLADFTFGENWLVDGTEAVLQATETRRTKQAHLVGVLKAKAADDHGVDEATFVAMLGRIEIPKAIWKSSVLPLAQGGRSR